jgi:hypothetical protein
MARSADVALRLGGRLDHLRRLKGAGPHEALDRGNGEAVAFPAGQFARRDERRRRRGRQAGSEHKAGDRVQKGIHD